MSLPYIPPNRRNKSKNKKSRPYIPPNKRTINGSFSSVGCKKDGKCTMVVHRNQGIDRVHTPPTTVEGKKWRAPLNKYINWGAGPRASQYLIIASKCNALINGKFSPDIENVQNVAFNVLRHRLVKNYKADAELISIDQIISNLL